MVNRNRDDADALLEVGRDDLGDVFPGEGDVVGARVKADGLEVSNGGGESGDFGATRFVVGGWDRDWGGEAKDGGFVGLRFGREDEVSVCDGFSHGGGVEFQM